MPDFKYNEDIPLRVSVPKDYGSPLHEEYTPEGQRENTNTFNVIPRQAPELPYLSNFKVVNAMSRTNSHKLKRTTDHMVAPDKLDSKLRSSSPSRPFIRKSKTTKKKPFQQDSEYQLQSLDDTPTSAVP